MGDQQAIRAEGVHESIEGALHPCEVAVEVQVVWRHVGDDGDPRSVGHEGSVALVGFDHHRTHTDTGTCAVLHHDGSDDESGRRRIPGQAGEDHRAGGRLAVGSSDCDRIAVLTQSRYPLSTV